MAFYNNKKNEIVLQVTNKQTNKIKLNKIFQQNCCED